MSWQLRSSFHVLGEHVINVWLVCCGHAWSVLGPCLVHAWPMLGPCLVRAYSMFGPCLFCAWSMLGPCFRSYSCANYCAGRNLFELFYVASANLPQGSGATKGSAMRRVFVSLHAQSLHPRHAEFRGGAFSLGGSRRGIHLWIPLPTGDAHARSMDAPPTRCTLPNEGKLGRSARA